MDKSSSNKRILLGMSGGTDSSVSALLMQKSGLEVIGATFVFSELEKQNQKNIKDAKQLAEALNIKHHVIDLHAEFKEKIIKRFIQEYSEGKTPFPCAFCNPELKFKNLKQLAAQYKCDFIATGHYAIVAEDGGKKYISKGTDPEKDQSFFLWGLNEEIINSLILPLGKLYKTQVRKMASEHGLSDYLAEKKDSTGICFIEGNNYRKYLNDKGITAVEGNFVNRTGAVLGKHNGIINYTIGQRRGLGINLNKPVFVSEIRAAKNEIVLDEFNALFKTKIWIKNIHFVHFESIKHNVKYIVKIRYRLQETQCKINILDGNHAEIHLMEPVAMVANGQTAVIYKDNRVIGGGFIERSE